MSICRLLLNFSQGFGDDSVIAIMGRRTRLFLSLYAGFVVYCLAVLFWGQTGIVAHARLLGVEGRLQANMKNLEQINGRLQQEFEALRSDPAAIKLEARQLGYYAPGELPIYLSGYRGNQSSYEVGTVVNAAPPKMPGDSVFRVIGLAVALIFYLMSGIFLKNKNDHFRKRSAGEAPAR